MTTINNLLFHRQFLSIQIQILFSLCVYTTTSLAIPLFNGLVPIAPIATEFHPSPYTVVTTPVGIAETALNFFTSAFPSTELQLPILPALHIPTDIRIPSVLKNDIQNQVSSGAVASSYTPPALPEIPISPPSIGKPSEIVNVDFSPVGDNVVHRIDSPTQTFAFTLPKVYSGANSVVSNTGFSKYGLPSGGNKIQPSFVISNLPAPISVGPQLPASLTIPIPSTLPVAQFPTYQVPSIGGGQTAPLPTPVNNIIGPIPSANPQTGTIQLPENTRVNIIDDKNQYTNGFSLPDGTKVTEQGKLISTDDGWEYVIAKKGSYQYVSPEGTPIKVNWVADENGFRVL